MSEHLKDVNSRLRNKRELIIEHLLMLYFYRGSPWDRDWVVHTYNAVFWVPLKKGSNKFPPEDWMYDCLFGGIEDVWGNIYKGFVNVMRVKFKDWGVSVLQHNREQETFSFVKCYMLWLARRLHESGEVSLDEVEGEIGDLLKAFPFEPQLEG
jgi:hypothetical protein